jgi:hypothetical protein
MTQHAPHLAGKAVHNDTPSVVQIFPSQRLLQWVRAFGISELARTKLACRAQIQAWLSAHPPNIEPAAARKLMWLSQQYPLDCGPLTWSDCYEGDGTCITPRRHRRRWETDAQLFVGLVQRGVCGEDQAEQDLGVSPEERRTLESFARLHRGSPLARTIRRELLLREKALAEFRRLRALAAVALPRAA